MKYLSLAVVLAASSSLQAADDRLTRVVQPFLATHCVKCHGPEKQAGDVRLDDLKPGDASQRDRWRAVRDQLRDGLMPPAKQPRPDEGVKREVMAWIASTAGVVAPRLPNQGNLVPHELLFGPPSALVGASPDRVWRLSPDAYTAYVRGLSKLNHIPGITQPFTLTSDRGIRDYSGLYSIDLPSTEILIRNAAAIVEAQAGHDIRDGKVVGRRDTVKELVRLMDPAAAPTRPDLEAAIQMQHRLALGRSASSEDVERYLKLFEKCVRDGDHAGAAKTMLQAILLQTDAMYRAELGQGDADGPGRRRLSALETARSINLALGSKRDSALFQAAEKGQLQTREQVAAQVRRLLDDPKADTSRLLAFFHEYFEYDKADEVFKDKPKDFMYLARGLIEDTDRLVLHILKEDRDVFRRLLTTDESFVNATIRQNKKNEKELQRAAVPNPNNNKGQAPPEAMYGLTQWPAAQPVKLPPETRIGILMQPSWLAAWSTNFDNDPVRRGRWVRERLLGGTVPDLPIGVAAQVPDEPHRTFRDRLTVTREGRCWTCHQRMDDLGLPFENFDHYGRFRTTEKVLDPEATEKNVDKKGKPLGPVQRDTPLVATGLIADSGDPTLDGTVKDPREMIRKIANSDRARQVFVRHAFRFFMGRNESLSDARTLQEADRAFTQSGGSFKALVASLLTSDPFLYRITPSPESTAGESK